MRLLVPVLAALLLAPPLASAVRDPREIHVDAVLCTYDQTFYVDNSFATVRCAVRGQEIVYYRAGSGFAGPWCESRVLGSPEPSLCLGP